MISQALDVAPKTLGPQVGSNKAEAYKPILKASEAL